MDTTLIDALRGARVTLLSLRHPRDGDDAQRLLMHDMIQFLLRHGVQARAESEVTEIAMPEGSSTVPSGATRAPWTVGKEPGLSSQTTR